MKPHLTALLVVSILGLAGPVHAQGSDEKQAKKLLKTTLAQALKAHGQALKGLLAPATSVLKETKAAVSSGTAAPGDSAEALASVMSLLDFALCDATSEAVLSNVSIALDTALSAAGLPLPQAALVGTGGVLDKKLAALEKKHKAALAKSRKASRAVLLALAAQGQPASMRTPDTMLPAFAPGFFGTGPTPGPEGTESAFALPPLQITALVGHSDGDDAGDGTLHVAGFSLVPDDVKISGKGPEGNYFEPVVVTPLPDGSFEATITGLAEGNWRVQAVAAVALVTEYVGIPGAPDPGTDPLTPAQVAKDAKKAWNQLAKAHGQFLKAEFKALKAALKAAKKAIKAGTDPELVLEGVFLALNAFEEALDDATNGPSGALGVAVATFGGTLDGLDQVVPEQLVGYGHANDKASARIDKRLKQRATQAVKSARAFAKFLAKKTDWRMAVDLEPIILRRAAPVKGDELPGPTVPLRFELLVGSSRVGVNGDGQLRLRIDGDEELGPRIDLVLFGPGGFAIVDTFSASEVQGGIDVRYPEEGPAALPEGNYVAVLSQGSVIVSAAISVPGTN